MIYDEYFYKHIQDKGKAKDLADALLGDINEFKLKELVPELLETVSFKQNHPAHYMDVYNHTMKVIKALPNDRVLKITALLHDLGKLNTRTLGDDGCDHFWGHQEESSRIAKQILSRLEFDCYTTELVVLLINFHDTKFDLNRNNIKNIIMQLGIEFYKNMYKQESKPSEINQTGLYILELLLIHQQADLSAHSHEYQIRKMPKLIENIKKLKEYKELTI